MNDINTNWIRSSGFAVPAWVAYTTYVRAPYMRTSSGVCRYFKRRHFRRNSKCLYSYTHYTSRITYGRSHVQSQPIFSFSVLARTAYCTHGISCALAFVYEANESASAHTCTDCQKFWWIIYMTYCWGKHLLINSTMPRKEIFFGLGALPTGLGAL